MREIKFRAWDKKINKMFYSDDCFFSFINGNLIERDGENGSDKDSQIVMQYIGFNDENDKEIYEGDILQNKFDDIKVVEFEDCVIENCGCCNMVRAIGYDFTDFFNDIQSTKIIGNIYENPELRWKK